MLSRVVRRHIARKITVTATLARKRCSTAAERVLRCTARRHVYRIANAQPGGRCVGSTTLRGDTIPRQERHRCVKRITGDAFDHQHAIEEAVGLARNVRGSRGDCRGVALPVPDAYDAALLQQFRE